MIAVIRFWGAGYLRYIVSLWIWHEILLISAVRYKLVILLYAAQIILSLVLFSYQHTVHLLSGLHFGDWLGFQDKLSCPPIASICKFVYHKGCTDMYWDAKVLGLFNFARVLQIFNYVAEDLSMIMLFSEPTYCIGIGSYQVIVEQRSQTSSSYSVKHVKVSQIWLSYARGVKLWCKIRCSDLWVVTTWKTAERVFISKSSRMRSVLCGNAVKVFVAVFVPVFWLSSSAVSLATRACIFCQCLPAQSFLIWVLGLDCSN